MSFARMVFARVYYAGGLKLAGIHGLEYMEAGFLAAAIDGDLVRGVGAVAGGELQGDVVCSGVEGDTRVRDGIGESLPVAGIRFFCQRAVYSSPFFAATRRSDVENSRTIRSRRVLNAISLMFSAISRG